MTQPIRIQRKRIKGWKMPPNTVSVCRPGAWGNPHKVGVSLARNLRPDGSHDGTYRYMTAQDAVDAFRRDLPYWIEHKMIPPLSMLKGKHLACFCALDEPCHADVLLEFACQEAA